MSLLAQINKRQVDAEAQIAQEREALAAEEAKPDAGESIQKQRSDFSNMVAGSEDRQLNDEEPTPEEQAQFAEMEMTVAQLINGPKVQQLFEIIQSASDPVEGVGQAASDVIKLITQSNPNVDSEVLMAVGESTVEQLVDAYEEMNTGVDFTEDQMAEAFSLGIKDYIETTPNAVDSDMRDYLTGDAPQQL